MNQEAKLKLQAYLDLESNKADAPALAPGGLPKRHDTAAPAAGRPAEPVPETAIDMGAAAAPGAEGPLEQPLAAQAAQPGGPDPDEEPRDDEGPVHRPLIRASLPRPEGQPPPSRPIPEFTIRQPGGGRPGRFRPRHARGGQQQQFQGNRSNGNMGGGQSRGGGPRQGGHQPQGSMRRHGPGGRKRSK